MNSTTVLRLNVARPPTMSISAESSDRSFHHSAAGRPARSPTLPGVSGQELASIDGEISVRELLGHLVGTWPRRAVLAVVLVTPLVVGLAGGFSAAPARELPQIEPGEAVATGPYELALQSYFVTDEVRADSLPEGARAWLGVVATVTGTDDEEAVLNRFVTTYPEGLGVVDADSTVN